MRVPPPRADDCDDFSGRDSFGHGASFYRGSLNGAIIGRLGRLVIKVAAICAKSQGVCAARAAASTAQDVPVGGADSERRSAVGVAAGNVVGPGQVRFITRSKSGTMGATRRLAPPPRYRHTRMKLRANHNLADGADLPQAAVLIERAWAFETMPDRTCQSDQVQQPDVTWHISVKVGTIASVPVAKAHTAPATPTDSPLLCEGAGCWVCVYVHEHVLNSSLKQPR